MLKYNSPQAIFHTWSADFQAMVTYLRTELVKYNPELPVVLAVQRVAGRDRVYPFIGQVKQQQEAVVMSNVMKAQMEVSAHHSLRYFPL